MLAKERLAAWRAEQGLSRSAAATRLGCSVDMVASVENGRRYPSRRLAHEIERATAAWAEGPIRSEEWDEQEEVARSAAATGADAE